MILSAVRHVWLAVVMHFEPIFSVFQRDKRDKCIYIICVIIYDAFTCELPFCIGEYFPGNVILCVCYVPCLPVLVFGLAVCISGLISLNFMQQVYLALRRVMSHIFICTIAVYSKRETIFLRRRGILLGILTLSSQL